MPARIPFIKSENELAVKVMPNPFSNIVNIEFEVPRPSNILVRLIDNKASLVKQVYRAEAGMGLQRISIDGSALSNGIYFCEIIVGKERILRKLVLQK
jgi:hypothetical protein